MTFLSGRGDWLRDIPFIFLAAVAHGALVAGNPSWRWGSAAPATVEKLISVEFVAKPPDDNLAVAIPGNGNKNLAPGFGLGPFKAERIKKTSKIKTAALKKFFRKKMIRPPVMTAEDKARAKALREQKQQVLRAYEAQVAKLRAERLAVAKAEALRQKIEREQRASEEAARKRWEASELARLIEQQKALKAKLLAEARVAKAQRRAEIARELAQMKDPDEVLAHPPADIPQGAAAPAGRAAAAGESASAGTGASLAAGLPPEALDQAQQEWSGPDEASSPPMGGGPGQGGGDVSWSLDGAAGGRHLLSRVLPESPDWVSKRGLELVVKLRFQVLADGTVHPGVVVTATSGFPEIDDRVVRAVRQWKFEKAQAKGRDGKPAAATWGSVRFKFTMG
ncbi:MAG TPA: hypothetical protein DEB40_13795 [Elusimicrobia bacterium]|nr:hypothetical protein [Elusimicrobiota bacterium]